MTEATEKFTQLVGDFKIAMLVTQSPDDFLRARPMTIAKAEGDGSMWFVTSKQGWSKEVATDISAAVTMQGGHKYVSITGIATVVEDQAKVEELWSVAMQPWFPEGPRSEDICLIRFVAEEGEYWDASGRNGLRYLFDAAKAVAKGQRVANRDEREHGAVSASSLT